MEQTSLHRNRTRRANPGRIALALAGAGGIAGSMIAINSAGAVSPSVVKGIVVSTVRNKALGTILVSGRTLYTLSKSDCTGQCLKFWPKLLLPKGVKKATAGNGVSAAKLGTVQAAGGALQVTYSGKALYYFVEDKAAGQVHGNGLKDTYGTWSVFVTVKPTKASSGGGTSSPPATSPPTPGTSPTVTTPAPTTTAPSVTTTPPTTTSPPQPAPTTTTVPSGGGTAF